MRFKKIDIKFISLVKRGANQIPVIYKGSDTVVFDLLVKSDRLMEKGELTAVVYAPELVDSDGDSTDAETLLDALKGAMKKGFNIDMQHDFKPISKEDAYPYELFIIQKGDARFAGMKNYSGQPVDVTGGIGISLQIDKQELRQKFSTGEWNGVSMAGSAVGVPSNRPVNKGDPEMTAAELAAALATNNAVLASTIAAEVAKAIKPKEEKPADQPVKKAEFVPPAFKGVANVLNLKKHRLEVRKAKILHDLDPLSTDEGPLAEIEKIDTELAAVEGEIAKTVKKTETPQVEKSAELIAAETALAKAKSDLEAITKGSNQGNGSGEETPAGGTNQPGTYMGLTKEEAAIAKAAGGAAARLNSQRAGPAFQRSTQQA